MNLVHPSPLLKTALVADAVVSGGAAALQLAPGAALAGWLQLPNALLLETGLFLVAYVAMLAVLARSPRLPAALVLGVVAGNVAWAAGALGLAVWLAPSVLGIAYLVMQAVAVLVFAMLEYRGLERSASAVLAPATAR